MFIRREPARASRSAYTLLELMIASALTALVLVTTLALLRDSLQASSGVERTNMMMTFCVSKLESQLAAVAADFTPGTSGGDFSGAGYPQLLYFVVASDDPAAGGITDKLIAVTATVWHDENSDTLLSAGEPSVVLGSKVARMQEYLDEAQAP